MAEKKKVKLMDKRIDISKVGDQTLVQTFGKVCKVRDFTRTMWAMIKKHNLLLD